MRAGAIGMVRSRRLCQDHAGAGLLVTYGETMKGGWVVMSVLALAMLKAGGQELGAGLENRTTFPLWTGPAPMAQGTANDDVPTLTPYLPAANPTHTAVIVAPGGGYGHLSGKEADVAKWLAAHGVAGFVLKYRLGPKYRNPVELGDAQRAIRLVRADAAKYGVAPDHIGIWGFSAGGHLAASAGTIFDAGSAGAADRLDQDRTQRQSSRPDFLVLAYPVITMMDPYGHTGSRKNLLGEHPSLELVRSMSMETRVTAETPPTFLYATSDDPVVPVMNSVLFYEALIANKVPAEMHLYRHGPHGTGLAESYPELKSWPDLLAVWMRAGGWMGAGL